MLRILMSNTSETNFSWKLADIFHTLTALDADEYLQTEGYFANSIDELAKAIYKGEIRTLTYIEDETHDHRFMADEEDHYHYQFFLPADKVTVIKPNYRACNSLTEVASVLGCPETSVVLPVGLAINVRHKITGKTYKLLVLGSTPDSLILPLYGAVSFKGLFEMFELVKANDTYPFGVPYYNTTKEAA